MYVYNNNNNNNNNNNGNDNKIECDFEKLDLQCSEHPRVTTVRFFRPLP